MTTLGDTVLYASLAVGIVAVAALLLRELAEVKPSKFGYLTGYSDYLSRLALPLILLTTALLAVAYLLITYYFVTSDFTYDYVWQYSSRELPLIYKISGVWAGQPGTYLLWVLVIFFSASWFANTTRHSTALSRRVQIITILIGVYFIILTLLQSPFKTIYELPNVPPGFVPPDGSGLNALLVNFWMIVHPPILFIGYAGVTIPFATAVVYLITKQDGWEELGRQWARFAWLFLSLGIAIGGVWAYLVLGWGGFWAWDPVETASLVPWLALTGYLHAAAVHRKNKKTFSIAAPILAALSFVLVVYAALVVRSGLFNSVHAFGDTSTGTMLLGLIGITSLVSLGLGMWRYLQDSEKAEENPGLWTKTNIFYATLLLFVILTFISFWGITFPVIIQLTQGVKVGIASDTKNFFNVWSYPFAIVLLLAVGFCLNYRESDKEKQIKQLAVVAGLTVVAMLPRTDGFYVLDHNSPFFVSEPFIYKLIGSISLVSIFPPMIYAFAATFQRLTDHLRIKSLRPRIKGTGLAVVHFGIVFILFGAVISSTLTQSIEVNIPLSTKGQQVDIGNGYGIVVQDYSSHSLTENSKKYPGTPIGEIIGNPSSFQGSNVKISGKITNLNTMEGHGTLVELTDNSGSMWVIFQGNITLPEDSGLTVTGQLMPGFDTPVLTPTDVDEFALSGQYNVQSVKLEVHRNNRIIGKGTAEYLEGKGTGTFPMVDPDFSGRDVYVIFQGISSGTVPLTVKIIPAINFTWIGIIFFSIGIILIMAARSKKG